MHRRVRRLRLACAREEHARHGRVLVEDALRTATLHDEGRLIVVRRLNLGRIPLRASATQWSRRIEDSFRQSRATPVRYDSPAARDAEVVFFENRTEPLLALAERIAQRRPASEWFWPLAVPNWTPLESPPESLRHCVRALAWQGGLALTLQLAARLRALNALEPLLRALHADDLAPVQSQLATPVPAPAAPAFTPALPPDVFDPLTPGELECICQWGAADIRTHWLASLHILSATHRSFSAPGVSPHPAHRIQLVERWTRPDPTLRYEPAARSAPARPAPVSTSRPRHDSAPESLRRETRIAAPDRDPTRAAGLFFVVPLLARAALPRHLATLSADDAATLPWQILRLMLAHARTPDDDPLVAALRALPRAQQPLGRWLIAANRHGLRLSGLNLRQIIARPALVTLSATHIDLFFRPGEADVRLRRAALDLDPGWIPWLGRVIAFHFNRED